MLIMNFYQENLFQITSFTNLANFYKIFLLMKIRFAGTVQMLVLSIGHSFNFKVNLSTIQRIIIHKCQTFLLVINQITWTF